MMRLALLETGTAHHTAPITDHERQELCCRGVASKPTQPERTSVDSLEQQRQITGRDILGHQLVADRTAADLTGGPTISATVEIADSDGDDHRRSTATRPTGPTPPTSTDTTAAGSREQSDRSVEPPMRERDMVDDRTVAAAGITIGGIGLRSDERPDPIDQRIRTFDPEPGQSRIRPGGRNRVAADTADPHLCLISSVGIGGRGSLRHVLLDDPGRLVGSESTDQVKQVGRDLPRRFVGGLGHGVDSVAAHPASDSLLRQPGIGGQRRCPAGISIHRSTGPAPAGPTRRKMGSSPPTIRAGVATGPGQPGDCHEANRLQLLLPPGGQRDQPTVSLSRQIADQRFEPGRQISDGINRTANTINANTINANNASTANAIHIDFTACTAARCTQHLHTINTKQPL